MFYSARVDALSTAPAPAATDPLRRALLEYLLQFPTPGLQFSVAFLFVGVFPLDFSQHQGQLVNLGLGPVRSFQFIVLAKDVLVLFLQLPMHLLKPLELFPLQLGIFLLPALDFLELFLEFVLFCDLGQDLVAHGLEVGLQKFGLHLVRLAGVIADGVEVVGHLVFLEWRRGVSEGLVVEGVKIVGR